MKSLEDKIRREGRILEGDILKVDGFLNHRIDVGFLFEMGKEFYRLYRDAGVNKILTIEASGIGAACVCALAFEPVLPVVFAKKSVSSNIGTDVYSAAAHSYTHKKDYSAVVSKAYLGSGDRVLILDDFLAKGSALRALLDLCRQAGAEVAGVGIVVEKAYQGGGDLLRSEGIRIESLAQIASMSAENGIVFRQSPGKAEML